MILWLLFLFIYKLYLKQIHKKIFDMYGIFSVIFIVIATLIYYKASTYSELPFEVSQVQLSRFLVNQNYSISGTCVDKAVLSKSSLQQIKISSHSPNTFAILLDRNPYLQCRQLVHAFSFTTSKSKKTHIVLDDISAVKSLVGNYEVRNLEQNVFLKIKNHETFVLIISVQQIKKQSQKETLSQKQAEPILTQDIISLAVQNQNYLQPILKPLLLFGCFNLIGISLIAYYKKNVFNKRVKLLSTVTLLVYLMWIGYDTPCSLQQAEQKIQIAMTCYLLIICIKNRLTTCQTSIILAFSALNQIILSALLHKNDQDYSLFLWLVYALNFINASFITQGQNVEIVYFSIFGFVVQYGLINQSIDIMHPLILSLILVTLLFGPTIFQLLQLKENFDHQQRKTKERLQSYELSQSDTLFRN